MLFLFQGKKLRYVLIAQISIKDASSLWHLESGKRSEN
jgi:hypothetical protein